jgi:outer membrane protein W
MLQRNWNRILLIGLACLAIGSIAIPALAVDGQWHIRAHAAWVQPDLNWQMSPEGGTAIAVDANSAWGLGINGEYQVSELLGVELGIMRAVPDIDLHVENRDLGLSASASDGLTMTPLSLGLNFHLTPKRNYDLYIGPFLAYVLYSDLEWSISETLIVDGVPVEFEDSLRIAVANDLAYGAVVGADIPFGSKGWFFSGSLRYMVTKLDSSDDEGDGERLDFDPFIVSLGVRYSF